MDIVTMLLAERERINKALEALGYTAEIADNQPRTKRKYTRRASTGRTTTAKRPMGTKTHTMSANGRKALSEKMKARWAARKKARKAVNVPQENVHHDQNTLDTGQ